VDWVDVSDADAVWNEEKACRGFKREDNKDMFKGSPSSITSDCLDLVNRLWLVGICDFRSQGGATSPATCCSICEEYAKFCQAFTFSTGTCYLKSCGVESIQEGGGEGSFLVGAVTGYRKKRS
jgi:hypothetical protein